MKEYVLITGATSGIGYDLAQVFKENNYNLILVARNEKKLNEIKNQFNKNIDIDVETFICDLSNEKEILDLSLRIINAGFKIKYLINNAGCGSFGKFDEIDTKKDLNIIDINIKAITYMMKLFIPIVKQCKNSGILNVASTAAFSPGPYMGVYYASKAYVINISQALREEYKKDNINISVLCPGPTRTSFQKNADINKGGNIKPSMMESRKVAEIAYKQFIRKKAIIIPGYNNKLLILFSKLIPNSLLTKIILKSNVK